MRSAAIGSGSRPCSTTADIVANSNEGHGTELEQRSDNEVWQLPVILRRFLDHRGK